MKYTTKDRWMILVGLMGAVFITACQQESSSQELSHSRASSTKETVDLSAQAEAIGVSVRMVFEEEIIEATCYQNQGELPDSIIIYLQGVAGKTTEESVILHRESKKSSIYTAEVDPTKPLTGRWQLSVMPFNKSWRLSGMATITHNRPIWVKAISAKVPKMPYHSRT